MVGFGAKGKTSTAVDTFCPDRESEVSGKGSEMPADGIAIAENASGGVLSAQRHVHPGITHQLMGGDSALEPMEVIVRFIDPYLNALRRWNERAETEDESEVEDRLEELFWPLIALARGIGWDLVEGYWQPAEFYLVLDAPGKIHNFRQTLKALLREHMVKMHSYSIEEQSRLLRLLKLRVSEICGILETFSAKLRSHCFERPTVLALPTNARCDPQSTDDSRGGLPDLQVDKDNYKARYNGVVYDLNDSQTTLLAALVDANGDWIPASKHVEVPRRVKRSLDAALRTLIESSPGKGYRLKRQ